MSRIGKQPIPIGSGVKVTVDGGNVSVQGPNGVLSFLRLLCGAFSRFLEPLNFFLFTCDQGASWKQVSDIWYGFFA